MEQLYIDKDKVREKIDDYERYKGTVMYEKYNYREIISVLQKLLVERIND